MTINILELALVVFIAALGCVAGLLTIGMCRAAKRGEQDEVHP